MKTYVNSGKSVSITASRDLQSDDPYAVGDLFGFAQTNAIAGGKVTLATEGVYKVSVAAAANVNAGDAVYFDGTELTTAPDDGAEGDPYLRAGTCYLGGAAAAGRAPIHIKINA